MSINIEKRGRFRLKRFKAGAFFFLVLGMTNVHAQESINAAGGNASGNGGSMNYSIGQVAFQTQTGTNGTIAQGVQQPYEISVVTEIEAVKGIRLSVSAYPNPSTDYLTLSVDEFDVSNLSYHLYDLQGKLLQSGDMAGRQTSIAMRDLAPAHYFLRVLQGEKEIKIFKIIKN